MKLPPSAGLINPNFYQTTLAAVAANRGGHMTPQGFPSQGLAHQNIPNSGLPLSTMPTQGQEALEYYQQQFEHMVPQVGILKYVASVAGMQETDSLFYYVF